MPAACRTRTTGGPSASSLTPAGRDAIDRIRATSSQGVQRALVEWAPAELQRLATLFHGMVHDFLAHATENEERGSGRGGRALGWCGRGSELGWPGVEG